jgi:hypothetical protein
MPIVLLIIPPSLFFPPSRPSFSAHLSMCYTRDRRTRADYGRVLARNGTRTAFGIFLLAQGSSNEDADRLASTCPESENPVRFRRALWRGMTMITARRSRRRRVIATSCAIDHSYARFVFGVRRSLWIAVKTAGWRCEQIVISLKG